MEKTRSITVVCWTLTLTFIKGLGNRAFTARDKYFVLYLKKRDICVLILIIIFIIFLCLLFFEENKDTYRTLSEENIKLQAEVMQYKVQRKK